MPMTPPSESVASALETAPSPVSGGDTLALSGHATLGLGPVAIGQLPQRLAPAHAWQAARSTGAFTLVGCTVAPGFDFAGFQLLSADPQAQRDWPMLVQLHPELV